MKYSWLKIEFPVRRTLPLMVVNRYELMELYHSASVVSVCLYEDTWDIDDGEIGVYNGHRLILMEALL